MKAKNVVQPTTADPRRAIYHLKVHILNISPMIYRRFIIDGNTHLAELHHLIQMMMGWENQHLHVFHIWGVDYGIAYAGGTYYRDDPTQIFIGNLGLRAGDTFSYVYDFGDYWKHEIRVETVEDTRPGVPPPNLYSWAKGMSSGRCRRALCLSGCFARSVELDSGNLVKRLGKY